MKAEKQQPFRFTVIFPSYRNKERNGLHCNTFGQFFVSFTVLTFGLLLRGEWP